MQKQTPFTVLPNTLAAQADDLTKQLLRILPEALNTVDFPASLTVSTTILNTYLDNIRIALVSVLNTDDFDYYDLDSGDGIQVKTPCFSIPKDFILAEYQKVKHIFSAPFMNENVLSALRLQSGTFLNVYLEPDFIETVHFEDHLADNKNTKFKWVLQIPDAFIMMEQLTPIIGSTLADGIAEYVENALQNRSDTTELTDEDFDLDAFYSAFVQIGGWPWWVQDGDPDTHCLTVRTRLGDGGETYILYSDRQFVAETQMH